MPINFNVLEIFDKSELQTSNLTDELAEMGTTALYV